VLAGIDVARNGLFTGTRGQQIAGRHNLIETAPFDDNSEWKRLAASLEETLRLQHHAPGTLARHSSYLHERTAGMIGSLSHLIRAAAIRAIKDGTEKITKKTMQQIAIDHAAETAHRTRRSASAGR
jgi:hypothetical protein